MTNKALLIAKGWQEYKEFVIPADAHETQLIECKRAFYAGARSCLSDVLALAGASAGEPTEQDIELMADLEEELAQFARDVMDGKE